MGVSNIPFVIDACMHGIIYRTVLLNSTYHVCDIVHIIACT